LHLDVSIRVKRGTDTPLRRVSVRDRGNKTTVLGRSRRTRCSRQARTPGHPSRDVCSQVAARATVTDLHRRQGRRRSLRPSWGRPLLHLPRVLRRPRSLTGSPTRVTSSRNALTARTKRYGLTSRSTGLKTQLSAACLLLRGQLTCLPSCPRWATRMASYLHKR